MGRHRWISIGDNMLMCIKCGMSVTPRQMRRGGLVPCDSSNSQKGEEMTNKKKSSKRRFCEVEGCTNLAKYGLFRLNPDGSKEWLHVCPGHEGMIGSSNMRLQGYDTATREKLKATNAN